MGVRSSRVREACRPVGGAEGSRCIRSFEGEGDQTRRRHASIPMCWSTGIHECVRSGDRGGGAGVEAGLGVGVGVRDRGRCCVRLALFVGLAVGFRVVLSHVLSVASMRLRMVWLGS